MTDRFFEQPILNSPYAYPVRHWELDASGQPTQRIVERRRAASFVAPIPKARKRSGQGDDQQRLVFDEGQQLSTGAQQYEEASAFINDLRKSVDAWRHLPESAWGVTPETARLLKHWRDPNFAGLRPFFCQVEAVETAIWLTEVAPNKGKQEKIFLERLEAASQDANPGLSRLALKLATGAGKTTVMAMLIAWQTINAARYPNSKRFTKGFLIVTPGITIRDRLQVLRPNDPNAYYRKNGLVPADLVHELHKAVIVITNFHAFKPRERWELSKGGRQLLQGRTGEAPTTLETEGQMLQRVMPELMGLKGVLVMNDEAHHCYRERPAAPDDEDEKLSGDERKEADENNEAARVWISGLEAVQRGLGVRRVVDLSATPFFLSGSGYAEGTLFPWVMSDFSLMDAIECGIVKLPRVPVADNIPGAEMPMFRELWKHIGKDMPKRSRGVGNVDPQKLPPQLYTALDALYGHYAQVHETWRKARISVPPCFIIVCNNTATSKAVYDYVSGFVRDLDDGTQEHVPGALELFRNHDALGNPLARPTTLLIDSQQLESGEALDANFRAVAADEIEAYKRELVQRTGNPQDAEHLTDQDLLRQVLNTVGKPGELGADVRCVVSVAMLTEGWDANTVTHVLGVRAFGTQLLCEQVVGRALRRQSYELNQDGLFDVEYADVLGIPFDFTAKPVVAPPQPPRETVRVRAVRPDRDALEIVFPRVQGYRVELPNDRVTATFDDDSTLRLTPDMVGSTQTLNSGIIGQTVQLDLVHTGAVRTSTIVFDLTGRLLERWRDPGEAPRTNLFGPLSAIARRWLTEHLECVGGTTPAQLMYRAIADLACDRIVQAIVRAPAGDKRVLAIPDAFEPRGSSASVNFTTTKTDRWETSAQHSHVNWAVLDSGWEAEFCRAVEQHPKVLAYVKNHGLGFEVPYLYMGQRRQYRPDFIVQVDDGGGSDDPLHLVVEIKGYRGEDAKDKKATMLTQWVPGVNALGTYGRWDFVEFTDVWSIDADLKAKVTEAVGRVLDDPRRAPRQGAPA
jgi:type III restriction enzyme